MNQKFDKLHIVSIKNHHLLNKAIKPLFEKFNIIYFYYCNISNSGMYSSFSNHVDWNRYWYSENFHRECFYFLQPMNFPYGLTILLPPFEEKFKKLQNIASSKFNINYVMEICYRDQYGMESYGFGSDVFHPNTFYRYINSLPFFKLFFKYFSKEHRSIFNQLKDNQFKLSDEIGPAYFKPDLSFLKPNIPFNFLNDIGMNILTDLSLREKQVCQELIKGFSAHYIGSKFNLSTRTIEYYTENIKGKLNCHSKSELVKKCLDLESIGYFELGK